MKIMDKKLGECYVTIQIEGSAVDSFVVNGSSVTLDRDLTDEELDYVNEEYVEEIQQYAYENGSRNHN